ncbi:MAG: hypothetical protein M3P93_11290 [Actinomycetota bacterium]|nr:hypothetical protein [Actinomycetota bacterium]
MDRKPALEPVEQVLAVRLHPLEQPAVERRGVKAALRRRDPHGLTAERGVVLARVAVQQVSLRHPHGLPRARLQDAAGRRALLLALRAA